MQVLWEAQEALDKHAATRYVASGMRCFPWVTCLVAACYDTMHELPSGLLPFLEALLCFGGSTHACKLHPSNILTYFGV